MSTPKDRLLAAFQQFDVNSDGVISVEELRRVLLHLGLSLEAIDASFAVMKRGKSGGIDYEAFVEWVGASSSNNEVTDCADRKKMDQQVVRSLIRASNPLSHIRDMHNFPLQLHDTHAGLSPSDHPQNCLLSGFQGGQPKALSADNEDANFSTRPIVRMALVHREDGIPKTSLRKQRTSSRDRAVMTGITVKEEERVAVQQVVKEDEIDWSYVRTGEGHEGWMQSSHLLYEACTLYGAGFNNYDVDGDGVISLGDLKTWMTKNTSLDYRLKETNAEQLLSQMDCNKDGKVSRWEFSKFAVGYSFDAMLASSTEGQNFQTRDIVMVWHTYVGDNKSFYEGHDIPESRVAGVPGIWLGPGRITSADPLKVLLFGAMDAQSFEEVRFLDRRCCTGGPGALKPFNPELVKERHADPEYDGEYAGDYYLKDLNHEAYYDNHCPTCGVPDVVFSSGGTEPSHFSCQKCGYYWMDGPGCCFHGDCMIEMESGTVSAKSIRAGSTVTTPDGAAVVICVVRTACPEGRLEFADIENCLRVTPAHPIEHPKGFWQAAGGVGKLSMMACDCVYNFVLSHGHILLVNGVKCVTLGHGFKDQALFHPYFGTDRILEDLRSEPGWPDGLVDLDGKRKVRCSCSEDLLEIGQRQQIACLQHTLKESLIHFTPALLLALHASAMEGTGVPLGFRKVSTRIASEKHRPPDSSAVPGLVELYCMRFLELLSAGNLDQWTLGAYCLWWVNSVHPFLDGNGRVARALCIVAMSMVGANRPASWESLTAQDLHQPFRGSCRQRYFQGLQAANEGCGFCSCCRKAARECIPDAVAPLAELLREIFPSTG